MHRSKNTAFEVHFVGSGITPAAIPVGTLTRCLSAVQSLAGGSSLAEENEAISCAESDEAGFVRLVGVRKGSAVFRCATPRPELAQGNLRIAGEILKNPQEIGDRGYILSPVRRLSAAAKSLQCEIVIRLPDRSAVLAMIGSDSYENVKDVALLSAETSLAGNVQRVGGATARRCSLRVPFQTELLYCNVRSRKAVQKLGQSLYEDVVVHGTAILLKNAWSIVAFTIRSVETRKRGTLTEAFEAIWKAGGHDWERFNDPAAYLEEARESR
jgi:hypothetical protein